MASLIKGQILKHLSKFVKNLNPSQISLSALKGEGELTNLELNEVVLTELLELPFWIRLTEATCNRASVRIPWTKLKTVPIQLNLDEIRVHVETCEELRTGTPGNKVFTPPTSSGTYGFTDKVVDGITVSVNLVHVTLTSLAFTASFQMSRIRLESKSPAWQKTNLQLTRLKDLDKGEVLVFKELSWQTVRIEAQSSVAEDLTPLRLITNRARFRITLKKRMSNCEILGCRLVLILDDLLWVLTDDQLKAALHFVDSISGLVRRANETTQKVKAERKLERNLTQMPTQRVKSSSSNLAPAAKTFAKYDVVETSYHIYSDRIDLHFCDDPGGGRSSHPSLSQGGAFQVSLCQLQVDYYPFHLARGDRKHWVRYSSESPHKNWLHSNLAAFDTKLLDVLLSGRNHTPLARVGKTPVGGQPANASKPSGNPLSEPEDDARRDLVAGQLSRLMTENVVLRLGDLTVWCVATSSSPSSGGSKLQEMCKGDSARLHLPVELPVLHLEFTQFYYPGDLDFPHPPPALMVYVNPVIVYLDVLTLVWLNAFAQNLQKSVQSLQASLDLEESDNLYADVKLEVIMPRIVANPFRREAMKSTWSTSSHSSPYRPQSLQIQASKLSMANYRSLETGSRADLATVLDMFQQSPLFFGGEFPSRPQDVSVVCEKFVSHATGIDDVKEAPSLNTAFKMKKDLMWSDSRDVWHVLVDSLWAEFQVPAYEPRPFPLLDTLPLSAWIYAKPQDKKLICDKRSSGGQMDARSSPRPETRPTRKLLMDFYGQEKAAGANKEPDKAMDTATSATTDQESSNCGSLHVLAHTTRLASLQLDHQQLIFLLRLAESLSELSAFLGADTANIVPGTDTIVAIGAVLPQVDLSIVLPASQYPDPETPTDPRRMSLCNLTLHTEDGEEKVVHVPSQHNHVDETDISKGVTCGKLEPTSSDPLSALSTSLSTGNLAVVGGHSPKSRSGSGGIEILVNGGGGATPQTPSSSGASRQRNTLTASFNSIRDSIGFSQQRQDLPNSLTGTKSPDIDVDTLSVRSDDGGESSMWDADGFVVLGGEEDMSDVLFGIRKFDRSVSPAMGLAGEVYEAADFLQSSSFNLGEEKKSVHVTDGHDRQLENLYVSTLTLHLGRLQFAQMSGGSKNGGNSEIGDTSASCDDSGEDELGSESSILLTIGSLGLDQQLVPTQWTQFQHRFSASAKCWSDSTLCPILDWAARLRLDSRPPRRPHLALADLPTDLEVTLSERISRAAVGKLELQARNLDLAFQTSTLTKLAEWAQDELVGSPLPLLLHLHGVKLHLEDDALPPPGAPPPPPIDFQVPQLTLSREASGTFIVLPPEKTSSQGMGIPTEPMGGCDPAHERADDSNLKREILELKKQLENSRTEVRLLRGQVAACQTTSRKKDEEVKEAQDKLRESKAEIEEMIKERQSLLDTLNYLQEELLRAGKK